MEFKLLVGLGNPGPDYENTRHNVGFWFVDRLAADLKTHWLTDGKFFGRIAKARDRYFLAPTTFMNRSGQAVSAVARFYKIEPEEILVIHDELDLMPGEIRLKQGGGNGGHNGLKDIQAQLGTPNFWRLRLGIGHPRTLGLPYPVVDFVLHPPSKDDQALLDRALDRCLLAWPQLSSGNVAAAQRLLHVKETKD
jgi:PTH1 family peptidyl-tRNA hydrolase